MHISFELRLTTYGGAAKTDDLLKNSTGSGQTRKNYFLKMQTDTNGKVAATVDGVFQP